MTRHVYLVSVASLRDAERLMQAFNRMSRRRREQLVTEAYRGLRRWQVFSEERAVSGGHEVAVLLGGWPERWR